MLLHFMCHLMETPLQDLQFEMFIPEKVLYNKWQLCPAVFDGKSVCEVCFEVNSSYCI